MWPAIGGVCGALTVAGIALIVYLNLRERRQKRHVLETGTHTIGWVVQANDNLYQEGNLDYPAFVLVSPDEETANDEAFMTDLAARVMGLKGRKRRDPDERAVSKFVTDEMYVPGKRMQVPESLTGDREVYMVHIYVSRDDLVWKRLTEPYIHCAIDFDDEDGLVVSRPAPEPKRKRNRRRDDDED